MEKECKVMKIRNKEYTCTVELTLDIIGGKWKPLILWHLGVGGTKRFSEVKKTLPGITQKMLTQQLRELESDGMINRKIYPQVPPKVEYSLTQEGKSLMPILDSMCKWGKEYYEKMENSTQSQQHQLVAE
ncbi:helix-turn-helix domain-containing protein [Clostridium sp. DJ247]|uniref:winged helix-turn-helix transcriptional regulator n=1 Tax=Clostridium sp. DJ247 TaxID=2726188 RepID=UPI00162A6D1A|nr:helix-turn-helix domain-containing protein [Clostridium sp. DJ247]MBC2580117.1 helix-turn-helix transcriptional regulator [Clostridium sp. DJ247]